MQPHEERVIEEHAELSSKIDKLKAFILSDAFKSIHEPQQAILQEQLHWMDCYHATLSKRIKLMDKSATTASDQALEKGLKSLDKQIDIQCADGNWNHDPYMHGLANGLLLAKSLFSSGEVNLLAAPDEWLCDASPED